MESTAIPRIRFGIESHATPYGELHEPDFIQRAFSLRFGTVNITSRDWDQTLRDSDLGHRTLRLRVLTQKALRIGAKTPASQIWDSQLG